MVRHKRREKINDDDDEDDPQAMNEIGKRNERKKLRRNLSQLIWKQ